MAALILLLVACAPLSATPRESPRAKTSPAWTEVLRTIQKDGTVSKATALKAFAMAIGPLPGVDVPEAAPGSISDGTFALRALIAHWSEITPEQRDAAANTIPELKGIRIGTAQTTPETGDQYALVAARSSTEIAGQPKTNEFYTNLALQISQDIGAKVGGSLGIDISVHMGPVVKASSSMETAVLDSNGGMNGSPAKCVITVSPWTDKNLAGIDLRLDMAHEVWHCFEGKIAGLAFYASGPAWIIEGEAEWVADSLYPNSSRSSMFWPAYLTTPETPLFQRSYDATGFFSQLNASGTDVWSKLVDSLGKPSPAAFVALGADGDKFLDVWASGYLRDPSRGAAWEITGPGVTADRAQPSSISVPNGGSASSSPARSRSALPADLMERAAPSMAFLWRTTATRARSPAPGREPGSTTTAWRTADSR